MLKMAEATYCLPTFKDCCLMGCKDSRKWITDRV